MKSGFSFCGVNAADIGLEYAPEIEDTYVYKPSKARIHDETFDGHDGGYYYGMSREPKEFVLRCFFEEKQIDRGIAARVMALFREGKSGRLIFDRRPWCYYYAVVTELNLNEFTNYLNGFITITMKSYYPFARSDIFSANRNHKDFRQIAENTAFVDNSDMIPPMSLCSEEPITEETSFILLNPGDTMASVGIEIAGDVGRSVTITNENTGQYCRFVAMSEAQFDGENTYLYLDGLNGKCIKRSNGESETSFLYHDEGFIELVPAFPAVRNIRAAIKDGTVRTTNKLFDRNSGETLEFANERFTGRYIWTGDHWAKILRVGSDDLSKGQSEHILTIDDTETKISLSNTMICKMNTITIKPETTMKITRLNFIYKPTFF